MIVSDEKKFVFTHVPKTGGTSIGATLSKYADYSKKYVRMERTHAGRRAFRKHTSLQSFKEECPNRFESYFKFGFTRNPWDRLVSYFFHRKQFPGCVRREQLDLPYSEWVMRKVEPLPLEWEGHSNEGLSRGLYDSDVSLNWFTDDNGIVQADYIGRFENLQEEFDGICDRLSIPREELPHKFVSNMGRQRKTVEHYSKYYTSEAREKVEWIYRRDIDYFGYKFEEKA